MLRRIVGHGLSCALAFLAFATGSALVHALLPLEVNAAWEELRARKDECEVLFLGTSRTERGIDLPRIEAELGRAGVPLRCAKLAVSGARTLEQDFLLRQVLALEPRRLRWIVLEAGPVGRTLPEQSDFADAHETVHARLLQWHTPRQTARALHSVWRAPLTLEQRLWWTGEHVELCLRNVTNLGALADRWIEAPRRARAQTAKDEAWRLASGAGEEAPANRMVIDPSRYPERARKFAESLVRLVQEQNALPVALEEVDAGLYVEQARVAEGAGVTLVHLTLPAGEGSPEPLALGALGRVPRLLHFNDPARFPELFQAQARFDAGHLNEAGAALLAPLLAEALAGIVRAEAR